MKKRKKLGLTTKGIPAPASDISIRRFGITYIALMGLFFFMIGFTPFQKFFDLNGLYTKGVVAMTSDVLSLAGVQNTSNGSIIQLPSISLDVQFGCNGLEAVMIYSIAVISFPSPWKKKIYGMLVGFLIIQAINIIRIAALGYSGVHFKNIFEYIHIYVAQGMMIAISLAAFFVYIAYARNSKTASP